MSRTSELVKLPGTVAAALFSRKGFLEEFEGTLTEAEAEKQEGDNRTMGRKHTVPYGLYRAHGFISSSLARQTGFSDDVDLLIVTDEAVHHDPPGLVKKIWLIDISDERNPKIAGELPNR